MQLDKNNAQQGSSGMIILGLLYKGLAESFRKGAGSERLVQ